MKMATCSASCGLRVENAHCMWNSLKQWFARNSIRFEARILDYGGPLLPNLFHFGTDCGALACASFFSDAFFKVPEPPLFFARSASISAMVRFSQCITFSRNSSSVGGGWAMVSPCLFNEMKWHGTSSVRYCSG